MFIKLPLAVQLFVALAPGDDTYSASVASNDLATQNGGVSIVDGHTITPNSYLNAPYLPFPQ